VNSPPKPTNFKKKPVLTLVIVGGRAEYREGFVGGRHGYRSEAVPSPELLNVAREAHSVAHVRHRAFHLRLGFTIVETVRFERAQFSKRCALKGRKTF